MTKSTRGFASLAKRDPERMRQIASAGGKASHGGGRKPKRIEPPEDPSDLADA